MAETATCPPHPSPFSLSRILLQVLGGNMAPSCHHGISHACPARTGCVITSGPKGVSGGAVHTLWLVPLEGKRHGLPPPGSSGTAVLDTEKSTSS